MAFGRVVKLFVGQFPQGNKPEGDIYDLSGFDIDFDVSRSIEYFENEAQITIHNLTPDLLHSLMTEGNGVVLQAGHDDQSVGNIFVGQIGMAESRRTRSGIETVIYCTTARGAYYQLARLNCSFEFRKGTPAKQCLEHLCSYANIALRAGFDDELGIGIPHDFRKSGSFNDVLKDFVDYVLFPYFEKRAYWDNNELVVFSKINRNVEIETIELTYGDGGLLSAEEVRDESFNKVNFNDDPEYYWFSKSDAEMPPTKSKAQNIDRKRMVRFKALITPKITPNGLVRIDSSVGDAYDEALAVKGAFIVTECNFNGSNYGKRFEVSCRAQEMTGT